MARKRGRGMAACWYGIARTAMVDRAGAWAELDDGGTAKIVTGVTEIGEGILTVLAQIAAEELGVRPQDVTIGDNDTARAPEAAHAGATRQTYMIGNAVALASAEARARLVAVVAVGILKDVVLVKGFKQIEVDVTPRMDGLTLFHCHQQLHMDYGFKLLFNVV